MLDEGVEIPIAEQQRVSVCDASRGNDRINRFAYGYSLGTQMPEILCSLDAYVTAPQLYYFERG